MNIDPKKQAIIDHKNGPLLVIAGPGAGKTMAIVERVVKLIGEGGVSPENIMISTFTEKAAKELITRISNRTNELGIKVSLNEMYIGTLHSIFLQILKDYTEFTRLKKNYKTYDDFDQNYAVYNNIYRFSKIPNIEQVTKVQSRWDQASRLCRYLNKVREEAIDPERLQVAPEPEIKALGDAFALYQQILEEDNAIDFCAIQTEMLRLIESQPDVLKELQDKLQYIIVDEYQDTNTIQEKIILKLAGAKANICVVGDEDQSIYRFRGASVRNILQFANNFPAGTCKTIVLDTNFRSHPDIVDFYNTWMTQTDWTDGSNNFRYDKTIVPRSDVEFDKCPAVIKVTGDEPENWYQEVYEFICRLKNEKVVTDYNQIAFLFNSVRNADVKGLIDFLESKEIPVFAPRSAQFFERDAVRLAMGLMVFLFPKCLDVIKGDGTFKLEIWDYLRECADFFAATIKQDMTKHKELLLWAREKAKFHLVMSKSSDDSYLSLFYQALKYPMFSEYLSVDIDGTPKRSRDAFNLAMFSQLLAKFEFTYNINVITPKRKDSDLKHLFNQFFNFLYKGGLEEFEDYEESAPSGCVSIMTIHQSKGLEFPVVCVGSLKKNPRKTITDIDTTLENNYFDRVPFEPLDSLKYFDFWRLYYVAFSRPQNLLVLTGITDADGLLGKTFEELTEHVLDWRDPQFVYQQLHLKQVKKANIKNAYAFTSDILLYENCPTQYMAFNFLGFAPKRVAATMFGSLVHQTIEDIHKAHLRGEEISQERIEGWFAMNYTSLSHSMKSYLDDIRQEAAFKQIARYYERNCGGFQNIIASEYDVSIPTDSYILRGVIDLLKGEGDTVEIVDFKSDDKPDLYDDDNRSRLHNYRRQLEIYSHIVEEKFGKKVSKMHLYYTKVENENPYVSWDYKPESAEKTLSAFDSVVEKIESHQFSNAKVKKCKWLCGGCDMRFFCRYK